MRFPGDREDENASPTEGEKAHIVYTFKIPLNNAQKFNSRLTEHTITSLHIPTGYRC